jgi:type VI secretion system protein ImpH
LGVLVLDVQIRFSIRVGPLEYKEFCRFMPTGNALRPLGQLTRSYVGPEFDFDVQPVLRGKEVPWLRLTAAGPTAPLLGWNTWVRCNEFDHDVGDAIFFVEEL